MARSSQLRSSVSITQVSDGGHSWSRLPLPESLGEVSALRCGASGRCVLSAATDGSGSSVENQLATSTDSGNRWVVDTGSRTSDMSEITCVSDASCFALGSFDNRTGMLESRDGGGSWSMLLPGDFSALSCAGPRFCAVSGTSGDDPSTQRAVLETTADGGNSWRISLFPVSQVPSSQRPFQLSLA
jgi:photosystem II stability/assembly factor-like uncharacterized protein